MRIAIVVITLSCFGGLIACQSSRGETELAGSIQGTTYHIKMVLEGLSVDVDRLRGGIEKAFDEIDVKLSNYREDSEISQLNRQSTVEWLSVSREIAELVNIAKTVYERSEGCYDLTVKPLFDLWGFSRHENRVPSQAEIERVLAHVGMHRVEVDMANLRIRKQDPELRIDLSSIAQGYTVAAIAKLLESQGIQNYLVEVGGEMKVKGRKANGRSWRVAIEKPTPYTREIERILDIHQQTGTAIMTAGTYRNFFEDQGQVYSHILDAKTGRPVNHHLLSVTVLHDDPTWADAWDTALLCIGETKARHIAEAEHLKVLLIYQEGQELKEHMSSAFAGAQEDALPAQ
jgi:thiamine biosynthesis lipoprotein